MDSVTDQFGRLSTSAQEWKPQQNQQQVVDSELNPVAVKEFVPGQGWNCTTSTTIINNNNNIQEQEPPPTPQLPVETTIPAGPMPFRSLHSMGLNDDWWRTFRQANLLATRQMDPMDPRHKAIPAPYCQAYPLDHSSSSLGINNHNNTTTNTSNSFGYPCQTFQVVSREDGHLYVLRRFDGNICKAVNPKIARAVTESWFHPNNNMVEQPPHPGIVPLRACFMAQRALFIVHDYIPNVSSLYHQWVQPHQQHQQHRNHKQQPPNNNNNNNNNLVPENIIWSVLCQWVSAIRRVHLSGLAVRTLDARHVLLSTMSSSSSSSPTNNNTTGGNVKTYLGAVGIADALEWEARKSLESLQQQDVINLGRLILTATSGMEIIASSSLNNDHHHIMAQAERILSQNYSRELHNLCMTLCSCQTNTSQHQHPQQHPPARQPPSIVDVSRALAGRAWDHWDASLVEQQRLERALSAEYESARMFRLLLKLGFINERPELGAHHRRWAQSGDCYVLTLFRDYVFHQADGAGNPVMDLGHVITALNKLDAADEEDKIVLSSRDGKSLMVVTYADVARALDSAYHELCSNAVVPARDDGTTTTAATTTTAPGGIGGMGNAGMMMMMMMMPGVGGVGGGPSSPTNMTNHNNMMQMQMQMPMHPQQQHQQQQQQYQQQHHRHQRY